MDKTLSIISGQSKDKKVLSSKFSAKIFCCLLGNTVLPNLHGCIYGNVGLRSYVLVLYKLSMETVRKVQ